MPFESHPLRRSMRRRAAVAVTVIAIALASCASAPPPPVADSSASTPERDFAEGRYERAAQEWQKQAVAATGARASSLRIDAANAWLLAGNPDAARDSARWVARDQLDAGDAARLNLVLADLALREDNPEEAETLLAGIEAALPAAWRERYAGLSARVQAALAGPGGRDLSRARALSDSLDRYEPEAALELLRSLERIPSGELAARAENPRGDRALAGWLDLALTIRQNLVEPSGLEPAIAAWKGRHVQHPLSQPDALDLWLRYRQQFAPPASTAVLLPGSGRFEAAARAIRDGIISAFLDNPAGAGLQFLATGDEALSVAPAYFEARERGAEWILGPLQPDAVEALLGLAGLATPVLALNTLPAAHIAPPGLQGQIYGLSLSQEDEVRAIAQDALRNGWRRAIVLAPESEWGERMASVFQDEFLREDTEILSSSRFVESENDHSAVLERLLQIDQSKARKQNLENALQMNLGFEPVRRDDVDLIFLAASAAQGRQLRPQFRFHSSGDIPTYATSRIYTGVPDRTRDQDLDGIRFPITPLQLAARTARDLPKFSSVRNGAFAALYALGIDAWNILPWLELMKRDPDFRFRGASGSYRAAPDGNLAREPAFATFSGGRAIAAPAPGP